MASYCNYTGPFFPGLSVNLNREGPGILQSELLKTRQRVDNRVKKTGRNVRAVYNKKRLQKRHHLLVYCNIHVAVKFSSILKSV